VLEGGYAVDVSFRPSHLTHFLHNNFSVSCRTLFYHSHARVLHSAVISNRFSLPAYHIGNRGPVAYLVRSCSEEQKTSQPVSFECGPLHCFYLELQSVYNLEKHI